MNQRLFRDAMGRFATGITIVSMYDHDEPIGMTVNAFMSVSLDPMLVAVSIDEMATMYNKLKKGVHFGVSMLNENQKELSQYFARQIVLSEDTFEFIDQSGVPVIKDALANVSCEIVDDIKAGDHRIFIGKVTDLTVNDGEPIIYYGSKYRYLKSE